MKKLFYYSALLLISIVGCTKEKLSESELAKQTNDIPLLNTYEGGGRSSPCIDGISIVCEDILAFDDTAAFCDVYNCLFEEYIDWNKEFSETWVAMSEEDFNHLADSTGFVEHQPLKDFEGEFGYVSFREYYRGLEDDWLDQNDPDTVTHPYHIDYLHDPVLMTLLNRYGEVQIGGSIFKILEDGTIFEIVHADCDTLLYLRNHPEDADSFGNVIIYSNNRDDCSNWKGKSDFIYYSGGTKRYKRQVSFRFYPFATWTCAHAGIVSYKQKANGNWQRWKTQLDCAIVGTAWNLNCVIDGYFGETEDQTRKEELNVNVNWYGQTEQTQSGYTSGWYYCNGNTSTKALTW